MIAYTTALLRYTRPIDWQCLIMLLNNERKRGATSVVKIFVEEDVIGKFLINPERVPVEQRQYCSLAGLFLNEFCPSSPAVSLFTSDDVRLQLYSNTVPSNSAEQSFSTEEYCTKLTKDFGIHFIAFGEDEDEKYLELVQNSDILRPTPIHNYILKNISCLLTQNCEVVITFNAIGTEIYRNFLNNYGVSVLSLSEDFNLDTITNARYEWIERHLRADPPNLALANQMTFEVTRRFAGDIDERYLDLSNWDADLFRKLPCSVITRINDLWQNHLRQQQNIFQEISGDYDQFRGRVSWYQDNHYLSAEELYALAIEPESPHLPCIFHFIDNLKQRESLDKAWLIRLATCFNHSGL